MSPYTHSILAAGTAPPFLAEVATLIVAGAIIAYVCHRFGLVPIVGFLLAGVVIGPNALGLVQDRELVDAAAEIGVILLLFTIGVEFSLEKLMKIKGLIFGGGGLQVGLATLATMGALALFGVPWQVGVFTGFLVALSSTAIVLKLLGDRSETNSEHGRVGLGLLIFQDLAVIVMALLVPMLGGEGGSAGQIAWALAKAGGIIALVLVVARRLMPRVLELVARTCSPELFLLTVIAVCIGTAYLTSLAGVSLSLGAFLAGLIVSESRFSEHALSEILPLQILFNALFFVSVGMLLDVGFLVHNLPLVLAAIAAVLIVKIATTGVSVLALRYPLSVAATAALMLAQVGEFSFVLERAGRDVGLSPAGMGEAGSQVFIAATVILMVATPLLTSLGGRLATRVEARQVARAETMAPPPLETIPQLENHVVVAGYGLAARRLVRVLEASRIPYLITTLSPEGANEAEADGLPVMRGDASRQRTLMLAGVERAKMLVIPDDDPAMARRIAAVARPVNPTMRILVRTRYIAEIEPLSEAGADEVVAEELESVVQLFADVLRNYNIPAEEIEGHEEAVRGSGYALMLAPDRAASAAIECALNPDCFDRRTVVVREGAPAVDRSLGELAFKEKYNLDVQLLRRNGAATASPGPDAVLRAGDALTLLGSSRSFTQSAPLFRTRPLEGAEEVAGTPEERPLVDTERLVELRTGMSAAVCSHLDQIRPVLPSARGCEECLRLGDAWVHLRICMTCGHVGCCDSSKNKHATAHHGDTTHPIIKSLEPGEDWGWCYDDEAML
jgi:CPA2 family monovalent cation:H+ antiporter-2